MTYQNGLTLPKKGRNHIKNSSKFVILSILYDIVHTLVLFVCEELSLNNILISLIYIIQYMYEHTICPYRSLYIPYRILFSSMGSIYSQTHILKQDKLIYDTSIEYQLLEMK